MNKQGAIYIFGRSGRMGQAILQVCNAQNITVHQSLEQADAAIDFTSSSGFSDSLDQALKAGKPFVSGTTGLDAQHHQAMQQAAQKIPVMWSANMSLGMNVLYRLAEQAAQLMGDQADCDISEAHHKHKKDAPSGTALELGRRVASARGVDFGEVSKLSREGTNCQRQPAEIGFSAVRVGDIAGEHTAIFALEGERIELTHRVTDRTTFARGAVHAVQWLLSQPAGFYSFDDSLS